MPYKDREAARASSRRSYHRRKGTEVYKDKLRRQADARRERYQTDPDYKAHVDRRNAARRNDPERKRKATETAARWKAANRERADALNRKNMLSKFGITPERYAEMLAQQGGRCAICRKHETTPKKSGIGVRMLAVDHCHDTGVIRGLLCAACNTTLGKMGDSASLLRAAADYLDRAASQRIAPHPVRFVGEASGQASGCA